MGRIFEPNPICAYGRAVEKTLTAPPDAGATTLALGNATDFIAIGDHVFVASAAGTNHQYLGRCVEATTHGITAEYPVQVALGPSATAWTPANWAHFRWGVAETGQRRLERDGTTLVLTRGGAAYGFQSETPSALVELRFDRVAPEDYAAWTAFRQSGRAAGRLSFALAWFDALCGRSRCAEVLAAGPEYAAEKRDNTFMACTLRFLVRADDRYVNE